MTDWKKNKTLKVTVENSKTQDNLELFYAIVDMDIADRWSRLIDENNSRNNLIKFNYRKILNEVEIEENFQEFKQNIEYINAHYDRHLTEIVSVEDLRNNAHVLNDLHEEFEVYGDRLEHLISEGYFDKPSEHPEYNPVWPGDIHDKITHAAFLRLNEQIHNFEAVYRTWNKETKSICTCLFDFLPKGDPNDIVPEDYLHEPLEPEDYFLFTSEHKWGWLYLGYNTLGKHWSSACHDDDTEVVIRGQIRPQARFAAESYMNFRPDSDYSTRIDLYNWWRKNNFSEKINPRMRLEDLALGFIPVARLHSYKIKEGEIIHLPELSEKEKIEWNINVWSAFNSIKKAEIINL